LQRFRSNLSTSADIDRAFHRAGGWWPLHANAREIE
jgi:hypothetical protein